MKIADSKYYDEESVFKPENLLREAKRQKNLPDGLIPAICLLDSDSDILDDLLELIRCTLKALASCARFRNKNLT